MSQAIKKYLESKASWSEIQQIIKSLSLKGFQTVVAGGAVRDALLKKPAKDIDLASSATAQEILKIFPYAKGEFAKYGVIFIPLKTKETLEITSFRKDRSYKDGRRPSSISYSTIEEDAKRRDFTINALFYDTQKEKLIDFVEGVKDLNNKKLKTVGKAQERFEEDHLRALRALRLAHQLDFHIDEEIKKVLPSFAKKIMKISKERILEELVKMFSEGRIGKAVKLLKDHSLFYSVFPSLEAPFKNQSIKNPFDFWNQDFSFCKEPPYFWTALALPFFYSDKKSFQAFLQSLLVSSAHIKKSLSYLEAVQNLTSAQSSFTEKLQALNGQNKQVFELADFWLKSQNLELDSLNKILYEFEERQKEGWLPSPLVNGNDLLKHFPNQAKQKFSLILKQAFAYQMEHPKAQKYELLKYLSQLYP